MSHSEYMYRCLELAARGRGKVGINPMVGTVLVRNGEVIAEGFHEKLGALHAERHLFQNFQGSVMPDNILYVSLEPCCHHGRTPPCTDAVIENGVKRVVYGMKDPDDRVAGKGIQILKDAGIEVIGPVLPVECQRLNRGYISLRTKKRPWITLKRAQTKKGEIANADGSPRRITSPEQDEWSHEFLRARHDAILVGAETVVRDDPQLTVRLNKNVDHVFEPYRLILDPHSRIPKNAKVRGDTTIIITADFVPLHDRVFDWEELWRVLTTPKDGFPGIASILVEGGARTWEAFRSSGNFDEDIVLLGS